MTLSLADEAALSLKQAMAEFPLLRSLPGLNGKRAPVVAVLRLAGPIGMPMALGRSLTLANLASSLEHAFSLRRVKAVALVINSPGGSPVQSALIHHRIRALAKEKSVPVFAFAEDVAASGGYMLALAGDEIYADASSIIGSIGVISAGFGFHELIARIGVERRVYTAGENKAVLDPFKPEDPEDVARLKAIQKEVHDSFKALVRARRGEMLTAKEDVLFSGEFWTGTQAEKLGLIDGLGDVRSVMRARFGENVKLRLIGGSRVWWRRTLPFREVAPGAGPSLPLAWSDDLLATLESRALWSRFGI